MHKPHAYKILDVSDQSSYAQRGIISAPIHMDNVACYGSEERLLDCTHDTDTIGDVHYKDIWVKCIFASDVSKSLVKSSGMYAKPF